MKISSLGFRDTLGCTNRFVFINEDLKNTLTKEELDSVRRKKITLPLNQNILNSKKSSKISARQKVRMSMPESSSIISGQSRLIFQQNFSTQD